MDPRVKTSLKDIQQQHDLSLVMYEDRKMCITAMNDLRNFRDQLKEKLKTVAINKLLKDCDTEAVLFEQKQKNSNEKDFNQIYVSLSAVFNVLQDADVAPTSQTITAANETNIAFKKLWSRWVDFKSKMKICLSQ
jgi:hypothetical protein